MVLARAYLRNTMPAMMMTGEKSIPPNERGIFLRIQAKTG
jgi:hypothetical protein